MRGACAVARPVVAGVVCPVGKGTSIRSRAGQDVVARRQRVTNAIDECALLGQCELLGEVAATARFIQGISVYLGLDDRSRETPVQIIRQPLFRTEPRPGADAVSCVDGRMTGPSLCTEVCAPRLSACTNRGCKRLTVRISTRQSISDSS